MNAYLRELNWKMRDQMNFSRIWNFIFVATLLTIWIPMFGTGVWAQTDLSKAVKTLQKGNLTSKDIASELRNEISSGNILTPLELSTRLLEKELKNLVTKDYSPELLSDQERLSELIEPMFAPRLQEEILDYVRVIGKSGLLNDDGQKGLRYAVENRNIWHRLLLLSALRSELVYQDAIGPLKLQGLAQQLRANGMVAHPEDQEIIRRIDDRSLTDPMDMLEFCQNARRFNAKNYSTDPAIALEKIFNETASLLPDLDFTDFAWEVVEEAQEGKQGGKTLLISLKIGDFTYWQADPLGAELPAATSFSGRLNPRTYYKIFNLALAEQGSLYRLHYVSCQLDKDRGIDPNRRFGIIALRESQPEAFRYLGSYYRFSKEDFRNALSRELVGGVIERYFSFGMFSRMTLPEYRKSREFALSNPRMSYEEVLDCFPGVFLDLDKTQVLGYADLLDNLADISRGKFTPEAVSNAERFSFEFGGDTWAASLRKYDAGPDQAFFALVDQATATLPEGRFYALSSGNKYVFLNTEQWDLLYRQKVVGRQK
jgi:hypothetical protein